MYRTIVYTSELGNRFNTPEGAVADDGRLPEIIADHEKLMEAPDLSSEYLRVLPINLALYRSLWERAQASAAVAAIPLCGDRTPEATAHLHQDKWIGDGCSWFGAMPSLNNPTQADIMFHLDRILHQREDDPGRAGYPIDTLWLEEARHLIHKLERDRLSLAKLAADTPQFFASVEARP